MCEFNRSYYKYLILLLIFISCTKDSDNIPVKLDSYIIYLEDDYRINQVEHFVSDSLKEVTKFNYGPQSVRIAVIDKFDELKLTKCFYLNNLNQADSCIDSIYSDSELTEIRLNEHIYDNNGYLVLTDLWFKKVSDGSITVGVQLHYGIEAGNVTSFSVESCGGSYNFTELESKIDIFGFLGDYNGKRNKNLKKSYTYECTSVGSTPESGEYEYSINSEGLVTERVETYYNGGYKEKRKTMFDYVFQ